MAISKFNYNSFNVTPVAGAALAFDADADGFSTATSTALTHIKTLTASSSATLSFVDGASDVVLDSTYPVYLFKWIGVHPSANDVAYAFNGSIDAGSNYNVTKTTTMYYLYHDEGDETATLAYGGEEDLAQSTGFCRVNFNVGNGADEEAGGELWLYSPSSTTYVKHFLSQTNNYYKDNFMMKFFVSGYCNVTAAIDGVQFAMSTGTFDGTFKLYGVS